jgi:uncharacterized membrane protein HdeD (DUF308 family)
VWHRVRQPGHFAEGSPSEVIELVERNRNFEIEELSWGWSLLMLAGIVSVAIGIACLFRPGDSLVAFAVMAGIFLLCDGMLELSSAFTRGAPHRGTTALLGVLSAVVGVLLIRHPFDGIVGVALALGIWLVAAGLIRLVSAFEEGEHCGAYLFLGLVELIAGVVIVASPEVGYGTLLLFAGIAFILNGIGMTILGWQVRGAELDIEG